MQPENRFGNEMQLASFPPDGNITEDIQKKYSFSSDLVDIYANTTGATVHKWHHYLPIYDRYFSKFRGTKFKMLEIGVDRGGSLMLWRNYFGKDATIFGVDINPMCSQFDGESGNVRIGSQDDEKFLNSVIDEMGGVDLVLDDGSHVMKHIRKSLDVIFPRLSIPGIYMIEDLHTAYWPGYGGGINNPDNVFNLVKELSDDMHRWYHHENLKYPNFSRDISGISLHDSIMVLEKNQVHRPTHSQVGTK